MIGSVRRHLRLQKGMDGSISRLALLAAGAGLVLSVPSAKADSDQSAEIKQLQVQIQQLQSQLNFLAARQAQSERKTATLTTAAVQTASTAAATASKAKQGTFLVGGGVQVTLGGFVAAESVYRTRNEYADIGSDFNSGIPFANSPQYHQSEFRGSARQSRISLLAEGSPDADTHLSAYFETDFLSAGTTSNSRESNSYTLRLRHAYADYDRADLGFHLIAGQTWSLVTLDKQGLMPQKQTTPLTIDAQYVPGFTWTRNWQLRAVEDFAPGISGALSVESPQSVTGGNGAASTATGGGANVFNAGSGVNGGAVCSGVAGAGLLNSCTTYSSDFAPDVVGKVAFDPAWGHFELEGLGRFFRNHVEYVADKGGVNKVTVGGGVGGGFYVPVIPKLLDVQGSFLAGYGIGRYGSAQFPDFTVTPDGSVDPLPEIEALVGVIAHATPMLDIYAYGGAEAVQRTSFNFKGDTGYGSPTASTAGCYYEGGSCSAFTKDVWQATLGFWWKIYKGNYGTFQAGLQDSYTRREAFSGVGGAPTTDENIFMSSIRYYPFQ